METEECLLVSGGARGVEAVFGSNAERLGIEEVNSLANNRGIQVLNHEELGSHGAKING